MDIQKKGKRIKNRVALFCKPLLDAINKLFHSTRALFLFRILKFSRNDPFDVLRKKMVFILLCLFMASICGVSSVGTILRDGFSNIGHLVVLLVFFAAFVIALVAFLFLKRLKSSLKIFLFGVSLIFNALIEYIIVYGDDGWSIDNFVFRASMYYCLTIVPFVNFWLGGLSVFWSIIFIVMLVVNMIVNIIQNEDPSTKDVFASPERRKSNIVKEYFVYVLCIGFMIYTHLNSIMVQKKQMKDVERITESIVDLDLHNRNIEEYMEKENQSKVDNLLQSIVKNVRVYVGFLPESMRPKSPSEDETSPLWDHGDGSASSSGQLSDTDSRSSNNSSSSGKRATNNNTTKSPRSSGGHEGEFNMDNTIDSTLTASSTGTNGSTSSNPHHGEEGDIITSSSHTNSNNRRRKLVVERMKGLFLERKRGVVLLHVHLEEREELGFEDDVGVTLEACFGNVLSFIRRNARRFKGNILKIFGGDIFISFNVSTVVAEPELAACNLAHQIRCFFQRSEKKLSHPSEYFQVYMSLAYRDNLFAGNVGTDNFKRFNVYASNLLENSLQLTALNRCFQANIIVTGDLYDALKFHYDLKQVDCYCTDSKVVDYYEVLDHVKMHQDEWMYQLKQLNEGDENITRDTVLILCWRHYKEKKFKEAIELLSPFADESKHAKILMEKCKSKM